ncbi:MAG: glycosyltransferase [Bacteroidota bacterium]
MESKTRITVLIDWFVPGYKAGGPIQTIRNFVEAMADHFQLSVITKNVDHASTEPYPDIEPNTWIEWDSGAQLYYFSENHLSYRSLEKVIRDSQPDFIYINSLFSLPFTIWPLWMGRKQAMGKVVLAPRGMLMEGALKQKRLKKKVFITALKSSGVLQQVRWQATDPQEVQDIRQHFGQKSEIQLVSNLPRQQQADWQSLEKVSGEMRLVFHSRLSPKKNIHALIGWLKEIEGKVWLDIYGPEEDLDYKAKCEGLIAALPERKKVVLKGPLPPDELQARLADYHFSALPTLGENFGHSIFEGLLAGKPVIISDKTPWRDLEEKEIGWDCELEKEVQFKEALNHALRMDQEIYDKWSRAAWEFARNYKSQPELKERMQVLFQ